MLRMAHRLWQRARTLLPRHGFFFDRPLVLFQSDDWGRVGLRDHEGLEELQAAGLSLGDKPYDFYTLETAEDVAALSQLLKRHRDASGRTPCLGMNFLTGNLDFRKMADAAFREVLWRSLPDGLPDGWLRPGLFEAYREGVEEGVFWPALHGLSHFCLPAVERQLLAETERSALL